MSASFVPAAVNLYKIRKAKDEGGELFRSVQRQKDQYQGIWIVSPEGKVLAGHHNIKNHKTWSQEVLETIDAGLSAFGPVEPRAAKPTNQLPHRGTGVLPDGNVCLAIYTRCMHNGKADGPDVLDSVALTADEWNSFAPPEGQSEWTIPEAVARKLVRVLSPGSDQSTMPHPKDAKVAELKAKVESPGRILLAGRFEAEHACEGDVKRMVYGSATVEGSAVYDKRMRSLLLVFSGTYRHAKPYDAPRQTGAVVEWNESTGAR